MVAYSSLPTESDRTHGTKDSDPFGRRVLYYEITMKIGIIRNQHILPVCRLNHDFLKDRPYVEKSKNQSIQVHLKCPSHLHICCEESKLTGKVTWMNSLAAMKVVRFTWKPSQTTWSWRNPSVPDIHSELHHEALAKKHPNNTESCCSQLETAQKSASKPWHYKRYTLSVLVWLQHP